MRLRLVLGGAGVLLGLFGVFRLITQVAVHDLLYLLMWLIGALIIHDGIVSPALLALGRLIGVTTPPRARLYLQGALIVAGAVTVIALPLIYRAHSQPPVKALLEQNFAANLGILLAVIAVVAVVWYSVQVLRDQRTKPPRPAGESSPTDPA